MPDIDDRLRPRDGLNSYAIAFARMQTLDRGSTEFVFNITDSMQPVSELSVIISNKGQSLDQMMVEAHDAVIDILRQLLFRADKSRGNYAKFIHKAGSDDGLNEVEFL